MSWKKFFSKKNIQEQSHVFITGLPRSGSTSILNFLNSSNQYASLKYKNMPFVLSPHFSKLFQIKDTFKKERIHGDGITHDINSPEAFDEIFFNNNEKFIKNELINYIKLILLSEKKDKYLSKNNLNFKRINLIKSILPKSKFLIPIREPLQHAYSLLNQHLKFCALQKNDDFIRRYMNYLGHKEFGLNHISWNSPIQFSDFNNINYWLEQWYLFYHNILSKYKDNYLIIIYEELLNTSYLEKMLINIHIKEIKDVNLDFNFFKNSNKKEINLDFSQDIYIKAKKIYERFKQKS